ncbi:F-box domain-containing protein [Mycena kentingensis (nom. inval.)]|nr:F-box domain-containing protein [Mycena kentingensis (nom. inval.)]
MESTPQTRAAHRRCISEISSEIEKLESEFALAQAALRAEQKYYQDHLGAYKYPVLTLPSEVVSEIFLQCIPVYPARPRLVGDFPENLAQICRRWRGIALGTPALWQGLHIPHTALTAGASTAVERWLDRSRTLPLSIRVDCVGEDGRHNHNCLLSIGAVVERLLVHRARWQYAALRLQYQEAALIAGDFPRLVEIDLHSSMDTFTEVTVPKLTEAYLWQGYNTFEPRKLPWGQLTSLSLAEFFNEVAVEILRHTQALVRCRLDIIVNDDHVPVERVHIASLKTLILHFSPNTTNLLQEDVIQGLLQELHMPNLKSLFIHGDVALEVDQRLPRLSSAIDGFGCQLERLCIARPGIPVQDCVDTFPGIAQVEVVENFVPDWKTWGYWNLQDE